MSSRLYTRRDRLSDRSWSVDEAAVNTLAEEAKQFADPLKTREDLDPLIERIGDAHFVLLGEASHGTSPDAMMPLCMLMKHKLCTPFMLNPRRQILLIYAPGEFKKYR